MADTPGLGIINLALTHLGQRVVTQTELNNDSVVQTKVALRVYTYALEETLRAFDWGFARVEVALVDDDDYVPVNYDCAYAKPTSCMAIRRIFNASTTDMSIGEKYAEMNDTTDGTVVICTDADDAYIRYTKKITDTALFDPGFVTAFSHRLAAAMAVALNGDKEMAKTQIAIFNGMISEAKRQAADEKYETNAGNEKANFVDARGA